MSGRLIPYIEYKNAIFAILDIFNMNDNFIASK